MLCRNAVRRLLDFALQMHPGQHIVAAEIGGVDVHQHGRVGVFTRTRIAAHAVGDDAAFLACRGHHFPAGAHAEGVHAAPCGQMNGKLVLGGAEGRVA